MTASIVTQADGTKLSAQINALLRDVPDFPQPGVLFKDITPLLDDPHALEAVVAALAGAGRDSAGQVVVDKVAGIEARGFILAAPVALALGVGFVPIRKPGKLPWQVHTVDYALEYGTASLELHVDAVAPGERVLIIDDVLATGGTAAAAQSLIEKSRATVHAFATVIELGFLNGRQALPDTEITVLSHIP